MPSCVLCNRTQSKLNDGNLCKKCFHSVNTEDGDSNNSNNEDDHYEEILSRIDLEKPVSKLSARELILMITSVIKETVAKDITLIKNDIIIIKSELTKVEKLESEITDLRETINVQQNTIEQQQTFLEYLANKDRLNNLIVTGVTETDQDEAAIKAIFATIVPEIDVSPEGNYVVQRLGNPETARIPRPVNVRFHNQSLDKKRMIVKNSKTLKGNERVKKVCIKKDTSCFSQRTTD